MQDITIRLYFQNADGTLEDGQTEFEVSEFGGVIPDAGDLILDPGVVRGKDRSDPGNRRMWSVVRRVFEPGEHAGQYVVLIVEERAVQPGEFDLVPG